MHKVQIIKNNFPLGTIGHSWLKSTITILLDVIGLNTRFFTGEEVIPAVNDVSFTINKGEIFGLVGESGSGKTVTAHSIMGLVHPPGRVVSGKIIFEGTDLLTLSRKQMEDVRGNRIGMVFQEPMTALNPVLRIGEQISEVIEIHKTAIGERYQGKDARTASAGRV